MSTHITKYAAMLAVIISLTACSNMNDRQQKMVSGAAIGTGVGAVGAAATGGCVTCGALIGAGVGTAAGAIVK